MSGLGTKGGKEAAESAKTRRRCTEMIPRGLDTKKMHVHVVIHVAVLPSGPTAVLGVVPAR